MIRHARLTLVAVAASTVALIASSARADYVSETQSQTITLEAQPLDSPFPTVSFHQFDAPAHSTLTGVTIQVNGQSRGDFTIDYKGSGQTTYTGLLSGMLQVTVPDRDPFQAALVITDSQTIGSGSFVVKGDTGMLSQAYNYTSASELSQFLGTGTFNIPVASFSVPKTIGDQSGAQLFISTNANGKLTPHFESAAAITVTYHYERFVPPHVPEPASLGLLGLGLAGMGVMGYRRGRSTRRSAV